MLLKKEVSNEGIIRISINGMDLDYNLSRFLTGTTNEDDEGIFTPTGDTFYFGDFKKEFAFSDRLDYMDTVENIAAVINRRTEKVRAWIARCKATAGETEVRCSVNDSHN